ncbi:MAG TPA: hypothetical protein VMX35_06575 [Acidobacteriota bacterium]|nr:hypothetical protein [Acidobacteriota bacterium]
MKDRPDTGIVVLHCGRFPRDKVTAELDREPFDPGPGIAAQIAAEWSTRLRQAQDMGAELFDGPLVRLVSWSVVEGELRLGLQPTGYKDFVGTNLRDPSLPPAKRADPLGNSALVFTSDDRIMLGRRSGKVFGHPGRVHCIGGHIEPDRHLTGRRLDTFAAISDEVIEELNVEAKDIAEITCLGLVRDAATHQPEQMFAVRVNLTSRELHPRGPEHETLAAVVNSAKEIEKFLADCGEMMVPAASACLAAYLGKK